MAGKRKVDVSKLSPEELAAYKERLAKARAPRPAYLTYSTNEDGSINVVSATRDANEVLQAVSKDRSLKYTAFEIK